jgi:hypothetical protein
MERCAGGHAADTFPRFLYSLTFIEEFSIDRGAVAKTVAAMKAGAQIIVQGTLQSDHWGRFVEHHPHHLVPAL